MYRLLVWSRQTPRLGKSGEYPSTTGKQCNTRAFFYSFKICIFTLTYSANTFLKIRKLLKTLKASFLLTENAVAPAESLRTHGCPVPSVGGYLMWRRTAVVYPVNSILEKGCIFYPYSTDWCLEWAARKHPRAPGAWDLGDGSPLQPPVAVPLCTSHTRVSVVRRLLGRRAGPWGPSCCLCEAVLIY